MNKYLLSSLLGIISFSVLVLVACKKEEDPEKVYKRIKGVYEIKEPMQDTVPVEEYFYEGDRLTMYKKYIGYQLLTTGTLTYQGDLATIHWVKETDPKYIDEEFLIDKNRIINTRYFIVEGEQRSEYIKYAYEYNEDKLTSCKEYNLDNGIMTLDSESTLNYSDGKLNWYSKKKKQDLSDTMVEVEKAVYTHSDGHLSECIFKTFNQQSGEIEINFKRVFTWSGNLLTGIEIYYPDGDTWIPSSNKETYKYDEDGYLIMSESWFHNYYYEYENGKGNASLFAVEPLYYAINPKPGI